MIFRVLFLFFLALLGQSAAAQAVDRYVCECGTIAGVAAHPSCVAGASGNLGTIGSPKVRLSDADMNALPAGSRVLMCQGGKFPDWRMRLDNLNGTYQNPIVFDSYAPPTGASGVPEVSCNNPSDWGIRFGNFGNTTNDRGYTFRNFKLNGLATCQNGFLFWGVISGVTIEDMEIEGFEINIHMNDPANCNTVRIRRNVIDKASSMGALGSCSYLEVIGNTWTENNFSGSSGEHCFYLASSSATVVNVRIANNTFVRCSNVLNNPSDPNFNKCTGGNLTIHGRFEKLTMEGNTFDQNDSTGGCYGISLTGAYFSTEWFRRSIIRGNRFHNIAGHNIAVDAAQKVIIENNVMTSTLAAGTVFINYPTFQFPNGAGTLGEGDDLPNGHYVRNNTIVATQPGSGAMCIDMDSNTGTGAGTKVMSGNLCVLLGAEANKTCWNHTAIGHHASFDRNICYLPGGGRYSTTYANHSAAHAAGFDTWSLAGGVADDDPLLVSTTLSLSWTCNVQAGSNAINNGSNTYGAPKAYGGYSRAGSTRDIGACENGSTP